MLLLLLLRRRQQQIAGRGRLWRIALVRSSYMLLLVLGIRSTPLAVAVLLLGLQLLQLVCRRLQ